MRVQVDDIEMEVDVVGDAGPAIVLLHGLGGSRLVWSDAARPLAREARVFVPDLRGCGLTTRGDAEWTLARAAADIEGMARRLGLQGAVVVGHSLGGVLAQQLVTRPDTCFGAAVLVSTSSRLNEKATANWRRLADLVEAKGLSDSPSAAARGFAEDFAEANPGVVAAHAKISAATSSKVYAEQARAASSYDFTEALAHVRCPVLVLQGLADRLTPPGGSVLLSRALPPGTRLEMIEGAGHNLPVEMPERFARLVLDFAHEVSTATH
jgi:pimeloyl-ACP methyl ester carboxylesterase